MVPPNPDSSPPKRLRIVDGMTLIAATAVGLVLHRELLRELDRKARLSDPRILGLQAQMLLIAWASGLLILSCARHRGPFRRLVRTPGVLACTMALAMTLVGTLISITGIYLRLDSWSHYYGKERF